MTVIVRPMGAMIVTLEALFAVSVRVFALGANMWTVEDEVLMVTVSLKSVMLRGPGGGADG